MSQIKAFPNQEEGSKEVNSESNNKEFTPELEIIESEKALSNQEEGSKDVNSESNNEEFGRELYMQTENLEKASLKGIWDSESNNNKQIMKELFEFTESEKALSNQEAESKEVNSGPIPYTKYEYLIKTINALVFDTKERKQNSRTELEFFWELFNKGVVKKGNKTKLKNNLDKTYYEIIEDYLKQVKEAFEKAGKQKEDIDVLLTHFKEDEYLKNTYRQIMNYINFKKVYNCKINCLDYR